MSRVLHVIELDNRALIAVRHNDGTITGLNVTCHGANDIAEACGQTITWNGAGHTATILPSNPANRPTHLIRLYIDHDDLAMTVTHIDGSSDCTAYIAGTSCRCGPDCEPCTAGDHYDCDEHPDIEVLDGPPCMYEELPGCGLKHYLDDLHHSELLRSGDWLYDEQGRALAVIEWDDDYPQIHPWKDTA